MVKLQHIRHLRRRKLDGLTRGTIGGDPGHPRLKHLASWLGAQSDDVAGTGTGKTFTVTPANDTLTITAHGYSAGAGPFVASNSGGALPSGIVAGVLYWVSVSDANTLQLHISLEDAVLGQNAVSISTAGTGTQTLTPATTTTALTEHLRQGVSPERLDALTDIDDLI